MPPDGASGYYSTYADAPGSVDMTRLAGGSTSCGSALLRTGADDYVGIG